MMPPCRSNLGDGFASPNAAPYGLVAMRAVVAVLLFVTAAHAALWGLFQEKQPAPDFRGILPSVSYAPFEPGHTVADIARRREDSRRPEEALHPDARDPPVLLDGRQRTGAADCRRVRPQGHGRRLDRQGHRPQQARDRGRDQSRQAQQQRHRHRRRQRNHLPRRAEGRRPDRADQAGQEVGQRSRDDRRNLEHLARQSGARLLRRFHRRARAALLGKLHRQAGGRSGGRPCTSCCATSSPASGS